MTNFAPNSNDSYVQTAKSILELALKSQTGFALFSQYEDLRQNTFNLCKKSTLLKDFNAHDFCIKTIIQSVQQDLEESFRQVSFEEPKDPQPPALKVLFNDYLENPNSYAPNCIWAFFWALAKAEHNFLKKHLPFWSHEERLTGHFVCQICERIEEFAKYWSELSDPSLKQTGLNVWYADTATAKREKHTGADLGLIIHGQYEGGNEFFRVARFQAKKVKDGKATIDKKQTENLLKIPNLGYYLLYNGEKKQSLYRPLNVTVVPASHEPFYNFDSKTKEVNFLDKKGGRIWKNNYDFAMFLTFALADLSSKNPSDNNYGAVANSESEAMQILMGEERSQYPSRFLIISLNTSFDGWGGVLRDYFPNIAV
ncbi:MAG: hypothetical protein OT477_16390 [Chloroflexi bacterium]|nr:hypothetical protein [Chloroflexota bacterium]